MTMYVLNIFSRHYGDTKTELYPGLNYDSLCSFFQFVSEDFMSMFLNFQHRYPRPVCLLEHVLSLHCRKKDDRLMLCLAYCRPITFHFVPIPTNGKSAVSAQTANRFERELLMQRRCNRLLKTTKCAINQIVPQHNNNVLYVSVQCHHCRPAAT